MRLVVDTNVLLSALLSEASPPARLLHLWRDGRFDLLTSEEQIGEFRRASRYPKIAARLPRGRAGRMMNDVQDHAVIVENLRVERVSRDPADDHLIALAVAGGADFLVTGDKRDLLSLRPRFAVKLVSVRELLELQRWR